MSLVSFHASNNLCSDSPDPYDTDCINDPHTRIENNTIVGAAMSHPSQALCPKPSKEVKESREIVSKSERMTRLTTETVQSATLSLEGVDNIERGDSLAFGVFCVGDSVANDTLEEGLQDTTRLFVDHWKDASDSDPNIVIAEGMEHTG